MINSEPSKIYDPSRHVKIFDTNFDPDIVVQTIKNIIKSTLAVAADKNVFWPAHPKDIFEGSPVVFTEFYMGAAGVVWALHELGKNYGENVEDYCKLKIEQVLSKQLELDRVDTSVDRGSYFVGEAGVRAVKQKINPDIQNKAELLNLIQSKMLSNQNELLYGLPGSLLISHFIFCDEQEKTDLIIDKLLSTRTVDADSGAKIWIQNFHKELRYLGAAHGTVGNYSFLLTALSKDQKESRHDIIENLEKVLKTYAKIEDDTCNWPATLTLEAETTKLLVHWCHGATGIVTELATKIKKEESETIDDLLIKAGKLIWKAGPVEKGTSICHGTAGSGMAMLKLYERTGDQVWFNRAKSFAMHAIAQQAAEVEHAGQLRYTLWTGDLGLALFLRDVLNGSARMPGIDIF